MASQAEVIAELYRRRDQLPPEKQVVVDELARRVGITAQMPEAEQPGFFKRLYEATPLPLAVDIVSHPLEAPGAAAKAIFNQPGIRAKQAFEAAKAGQGQLALARAIQAIPVIGMGGEIGEQLATDLQAGNLPGAAGTLAGIAAPLAVGRGIPAARMAVAKTIAPALERSAARSYLRVLAPTAKRSIPRAEVTAVGLAEEKPIALTREGFIEKAAAKKAAAGPAAGQAYEGEGLVHAENVQKVYDSIDSLRKRHVEVAGSEAKVNPQLENALDRLEGNLNDMRGDLGEMSAKTLDDFRDKLFRGVVGATGELKASAPATAVRIERSLANSIREVLDNQYPRAKVLNDTYKLWANAVDFAEDARRASIAAKGRTTGIEGMLKRVLPRPIRAIPASILGVFDSVAWNTMSGALKQSIADALAGGRFKQAAGLMRFQPAGLLEAGATRLGPIPDESFVRSEQAFRDVLRLSPPAGGNLPALRNLPVRRIPLGPIPDESFVRSEAALSEMGTTPSRMGRLITTGDILTATPEHSGLRTFPAEWQIVRDPRTGQYKRVYKGTYKP